MMRHPALQPLSREHHHALALCVLVERALHEGTKSCGELAGEIREAFRRDLRPHFDAEEQVLLPAIEVDAALQPLCHRVREDHLELARRVAALADAPGEEALRSFTALLRDHVRMEENELFEQIQARLGAEALKELGARLAAAGGPVCANRGNKE
ncbi:MAG: hypothetical protein KatS3mg004_0419 [Bryobacteraceae bacterium]|nr:MAG: hypothetical protein KatS3mg004_0419 [Bryobacteraceae bacterium]